MKAKAAKLLSCCKYELGIFVLLCIQALMNYRSLFKMDDYFYMYYLPDFTMGKTSRLLVGSIVNIFTDRPTAEWLDNFARIVLLITLLFAAIVVGKVVRSVKDETKPCVYFFALLFVSGSFTLYNFSKFFGLLDIYMFIFAVLAVICLQNKYLRWLVPVFSAAGVLVNYIFTVSYFPLVFFAAFYFAVTQKSSKIYNFLIIVISFAVTVGLTFFSFYGGHETMKITFEEFQEIVVQKSGIDFDYGAFRSLEFGLFHRSPTGGNVNVTTEQLEGMSIFDVIKAMSQVIATLIGPQVLISTVTITVFMMSAFILIWIMCIRNSESKIRKLAFLSFIGAMVFVLFCCCLSTDFARWIQAGVITQFGLAFVMFFNNDEAFKKTMLQLKSFFSNKKLLLVVLYATYAFSFQNLLS